MGDGSIKATGTKDAGVPVADFLPSRKASGVEALPPPIALNGSMSVTDILDATSDPKSAASILSAGPTGGVSSLGDLPGRIAAGEISQGQAQTLALGAFIADQAKAGLQADKSPALSLSGDGIGFGISLGPSITVTNFTIKLADIAAAGQPVPQDKLTDLTLAALRLKDSLSLPVFKGMDPKQLATLKTTIEAFLKSIQGVNGDGAGPDKVGAAAAPKQDMAAEGISLEFQDIETLLRVAVPLDKRPMVDLLQDPGYLTDATNRQDFERMLALVEPTAKLVRSNDGAWQIQKADGGVMAQGDLVALKGRLMVQAGCKFNDFRVKMALHGHDLPPDQKARFDKVETWIVAYNEDHSHLSEATQFFTKVIFGGTKTKEDVTRAIDLLDRLKKGTVNYNTATAEEKTKIDELVKGGKAKIGEDGTVTLILSEKEAAELDYVIAVLQDPASPLREALLASILKVANADAKQAAADAASRRRAAELPQPMAEEDGKASGPAPVLTGGSMGLTDDDFETAKKQAAQTFLSAVLKQQQENQQTLYAQRQRLDDQKHEAFLKGMKAHKP